jgi:hypothetical protein
LIAEEKMKERYSYEYPKGLMDGYKKIHLDNYCSWGRCFRGYGGCAGSYPVFDRCKVWNIPKILREIKKILTRNPNARFFLETPNFFDSEKMIDEDRYHFQELLMAFNQNTLSAYFSVQATPRDLIYFLKDEEDSISPGLIRRAGIQEIWLGVESANPELRRRYFKPAFKNEDLEEAMKKLRKYKIDVCFYLVISSDDTDETIKETVDFVRRTKPAQICPFDMFRYVGGEHYVDWKTMRANLDKVARYQEILKDLVREMNRKL